MNDQFISRADRGGCMQTVDKVGFTPGPWKVYKGGLSFPPLLVRAPQSDKAIADCDWQSGDEGKANARLIAAAPDLLQALESIITLCRQPGYGQPKLAAIQACANDAISRARGQQ